MIPKCKTCGKTSIKEECIKCRNRRIRRIYESTPIIKKRINKWRREKYKKNREKIMKQTSESRKRRKERQGEDKP